MSGDESSEINGGSTAEPAPVPIAAPPAGPSRGRATVAIGIAVLTLATALAVWGGTKYAATARQLDDITSVRRVAGQFGAAALTYDYKDLKPFEQRMRANATGTFRRQLGDGLTGLETLIREAKSQSEATVKQIYVGEVEAHAASAVVEVEARAKNGDAAVRTLPAAFIELQLVKAGGHWLIDGVSTLDLGQAVSGTSAGGTTTSTIAGPSK
jgi:hypothetical protein